MNVTFTFRRWAGGLALAASMLASVSLSAFVGAQGSPVPTAAPRGTLYIVGGGPQPDALVREFVALAGGDTARIVIFAQASSDGAKSGEEKAADLRALGAQATNIWIARAQADDDSVVAKVRRATGIWFGGGDQNRLMSAIGGSRTAAMIAERYRAGAVVGGTSAGAAVMSAVMLTGDERHPGGTRPDTTVSFGTIARENIVVAPGFGLTDAFIVDQHFLRRRRHNRLITVALERAPHLAIGIDESTALIVEPSGSWRVAGASVAVVYDARSATITSGAGPLGASGVTMHVLPAGSRFDAHTNTVSLPKPYHITELDSADLTRPSLLLWPSGAPGAVGSDDVDRPKLTLYPAPAARNTGAAVIVVPGGAYRVVASDHEGKQVAEWLNGLGVNAFVLQYRLGPRYHHPAPLQDAQRAIRIVRARAAEWRIDPARVGILGFSAGGHLASTTITHFDNGDRSATNAIDRQSSRPDFAILAYPVISMIDPVAHAYSREMLLGASPDLALVRSLSNELQVTSRTPPTFLFHTADDPVVPLANATKFYEALQRAGVASELRVFPHGPHGVGLAQQDSALATWPGMAAAWLGKIGVLAK